MTAFRPEPHILLIVVAGMLDGYAGTDGRLPRRGLAEACRQHASHDHFLDVATLDAGRFDRSRGWPRLPSCVADTGAKTPWKAPIGVRRADTITTSWL